MSWLREIGAILLESLAVGFFAFSLMILAAIAIGVLQ